jgi:hypothetical protein
MNLPSSDLALPLMGMLSLTMVVWVFMFIRRIGYVSANNLDAEAMKSPGGLQELIPDDVASSSNNLKNLFELPVLFYAVCLYLTVTLQVDDIYVYCAWIFLVFRTIHSIIHCTYNKVMQRFTAYLISSIALWVMVVRALIEAL